jgi:chromosome segregation ATPase
MQHRKTPETLRTSSSNRKKLSTQFISRTKAKPETKDLSLTLKQGPTVNPIPIASIIQAKVANLKHKFEELDDMRRKLIESRCETKDDTDGKLSTLSRCRPKSSDSMAETHSIELSNQNRNSLEKLENEKKILQKIVLEKNLAENENQEKIKILLEKVEGLNKEVQKLKVGKNEAEKMFKESEEKVRDIYLRENLKDEEIRNLNIDLKIALDKIEELKKKENIKFCQFGNDFPSKLDGGYQIGNKYLEVLQEMHAADQKSLYIIKKVEKNNIRKAQRVLLSIKNEVQKRYEKFSKLLEDFSKVFMDFNSISSVNKSSFQEFTDHPSDLFNPEKEDLLTLLRCQSIAVEELLMISS